MDRKMISAKRILASRGDVMQAMTHVCTKTFCNPMCEADLIHHRKLKGPAVCAEIYVCKYRQIHECGPGVCNESPRDGCCPKTGIYVGHPQSDFTRNPTYRFRKTTAADIKRDNARHLAASQAQFVRPSEPKKSGGFNFAAALLGQEAMEKTKEDEKEREAFELEQRYQAEIEEEERKRKRDRTIEEELEEDEMDRQAELYGDDFDEDDEADGIVWGKAFKDKRAKRLKSSTSPNPLVLHRSSAPFKRKKREDSGELAREAQNLVVTLFYSNTRDKINDQKRIEAADRSKRKIKAYKQGKKALNQPWVVIDVLTIDANERLIEDHIATLKRDEAKIEYFASVIMRVWEIVNESPWGQTNQGRIKFEQHCLGVLYHMRRGYQPDEVVYIPKHDYMKYLPHVNDLKEFGFEKRSVKSGMKVIQDAYRSAKDDRWPVSKLRMHNRDMSLTHGKLI